jgi:DNA-binding transcriptional regulator YiaG
MMKYQSDILETIHESASEIFAIGAISEERMREFDEMCLASKTDTDEATPSRKPKTERADLVTA